MPSSSVTACGPPRRPRDLRLIVFAETGAYSGEADHPSFYADVFAIRWQGASLGELLDHVGSECVGSAATVFLLAAFGAGSWIRRAPRLVLPLLLAALPYAGFFALWAAKERGGYFIALLPLGLAALARGVLEASEVQSRAALAAPAACVCLAALAVGPLAPEELDALVSGRWLLLAAVACGMAGLSRGPGLPRPAWLAVVVLAVPLQAIGAQRSLAQHAKSGDAATWARDAANATCGDEPNAVLITTGFAEFQALLLLSLDWPPPYRGTWAVKKDCRCRGPVPVDVATLPAVPTKKILDLAAQGRRIYLDARVLRRFSSEPAFAPALTELQDAFELQPATHGRFEGSRLVAGG